MAVEDVCRKAGISILLPVAEEGIAVDAVGDEAAEAAEEENTRLKKLVADLSLDKAMVQDVVRRKL